MTLIDYSILFEFLIFAAILTITPGGNNILTFYHTLQGGWRSAVLFRIGTNISYPLMAVAMVYGLAPIMESYPWFITGLTYMGAVILCYIAYQIWHFVPDLSDNAKPIMFSGIWGGILFQLINGKAWSMAVTSATLYTNPESPIHMQAFTIWFGFFALNFLLMIPWIIGALWFKDWLMQSTRLVVFNKIMSVLLVATIFMSL